LNLIINLGSTTKKYCIYKENIKLSAYIFTEKENEYLLEIEEEKENKSNKKTIQKKDYKEGLNYLFEQKIISKKIQIEIENIGIRVVATGTYFQIDRKITKEYISRLKKAALANPIHTKPLIEELNKVYKLIKKQVKKQEKTINIYAISDSSFHKNIPDYKRIYAIPIKIMTDNDYFKFGYHGLANESALSIFNKYIETKNKKIILVHLGGGCSITEVQNNISKGNTMGYTPLEGLTMATRSGDLDSDIDKHIPKEILYKKSGLAGISGEESGDIRIIINNIKTNKNKFKNKLAYDKYIYDIVRYIGQADYNLKGYDFLIFTGGVGWGSNKVKKDILKKLDKPYNIANIKDNIMKINSKMFYIKINENKIINSKLINLL